ncbi:hypothetical protein ANN_22819 [Periplaneta americana]|uniref:DUF659 domain-containing protein n=1 Tax=Periplaneta americana TaxID=6978 RepID=A0ABQ8SKL1_PERAM|nr:hypothetical protein ANN_22819 [Periplaneta americana]
MGYDGRDWINLAQDWDRWRAYVKAAMNLRGLATQGSVRRIDIIAIKNNSAYILDPTIRFETHADQPHEVDSENKRIYEPTIPADKNSIKHTTTRVLLFQTIAPEIPLPPQPVLTLWKTWLDAVNYYAEYYGKIMEVIYALDSTDSSAVAAVKSLPSEQLLEDILFIDSNFKIVSKSITLLESSKLKLSEALNIVYNVSQTCAVSSTQKFLVQQHITTSKHQANKQLNSKQRQLFLTQPTTSNEFLEKYTQHTIPDESTLRKTYAPSIYDETIQKIRDEIKDSSIWVSIDETPDKEGRLVGNVVIGLLSEQYSERILLHCDVLEKCNNKTIVKLFNEAMGILWPKGIMYDNVLFFISDAAPYMVKAGQALSVVYPKLTHFTCVAHAFHRVAEVVRDNFLK